MLCFTAVKAVECQWLIHRRQCLEIFTRDRKDSESDGFRDARRRRNPLGILTEAIARSCWRAPAPQRTRCSGRIPRSCRSSRSRLCAHAGGQRWRLARACGLQGVDTRHVSVPCECRDGTATAFANDAGCPARDNGAPHILSVGFVG